MRTVKNLLLWLLSGALGGVAVAAIVAPGYLTWNNTPGEGQALCDCAKVTRSTAGDLIRAELIGAAVGAVAFLVLGLLLARAFASRKSAAAPAPPSAPPSVPPASAG